MSEYKHIPVMLQEALAHLHINPEGFYIDGTFGRGGHSQAILNCLAPKGRLLVVDKDWDAIEFAKHQYGNDPRIIIRQGSFAHIHEFVKELDKMGCVDGILLDLGVSSPQIDNPDRGFSFMREGELDMRMDRNTGVTAKEWINTASKEEIAQVIRDYGQDRYYRAIAQQIVRAREKEPITTTAQLRKIIHDGRSGFSSGKDMATRTFQAIRIHINHELEDVKECLSHVIDVLKIGGRIVVISFHSLEERLVKEFFVLQEKGPKQPLRKLPIMNVEFKPRLKRIVTKSLQATREEVKQNPRAESARMRVGEKIL